MGHCFARSEVRALVICTQFLMCKGLAGFGYDVRACEALLTIVHVVCHDCNVRVRLWRFGRGMGQDARTLCKFKQPWVALSRNLWEGGGHDARL